MNLKRLILSAALLGGVLSTSALATTASAHHRITKAAAFEVPTVTKTVAPTGLPRRLEGAVVTFSLTIDANGQPSDIKIVWGGDRESAGNLLAAVAQWQFTPAKKNGIAVPAKVLLPVQLVES